MGVAEVEATQCPICRGADGEVLWSPGDGWRMIRCAGCGLVYENPRVTAEGLRRRYQGGPTGRRLPASADWERHLDPGRLPERIVGDYADSLAAVQRSVRQGSLLEVGSGPGLFLNLARESGFETTGVDIAEEMVRAARQRLSLDVRLGTLEECGFSDASFDVIVARHVIEHVPDLPRFWVEVRRLLAPGGLFLVEVPNLAGWSYRFRDLRHRIGLGGPIWARMYLPEHIYFFTPASFRLLADRQHFDTLAWETYSSRKRYGRIGWQLMKLRHRLRTGNKMRFWLRPRALSEDRAAL